MPDLEKVIIGLEGCLGIGTCGGCPYGPEGKDCITALARDALALLKAQEPRVLSWDEAYANNRPFVVWCESRYGDEVEPLAFVDGEYVNSDCTLYIEMNFANQRDYIADRDDGFRFWTAEPTFEQMEATPWKT